MDTEHLSSHALMARLAELLATERHSIADFVILLAELERRRLHLELGYSSLFAICTDHFKLTKAAAFRRAAAARLVARYPAIADYLRDGRLSLTTLVELRDVLADESWSQILDRAAGKTEDEVRDLVAALRPQPAPPDLFRRLPSRSEQVSLLSTGPVLGTPAAAPLAAGAPAAVPLSAAAAPTVAAALVADGVAPPPAAVAAVPAASCASRPAATLRPISAELRVLRITVDRAFADDLARAKSFLSHIVPDGDLTQVLHECVRRTIAACEKRRRGSDHPRGRKGPPPRSPRAIAANVRREVWRRDGGACTYLGPTGVRCGSTYQIEFHHLAPFAHGGPSTVENLTLRCRPHNQYAAEQQGLRGDSPAA